MYAFATGKLARVVEFGFEAAKAREWGGLANFKLKQGCSSEVKIVSAAQSYDAAVLRRKNVC